LPISLLNPTQPNLHLNGHLAKNSLMNI